MSGCERLEWESAPGVLGRALASTDPTPGGGAAAGTAGVLGCALGEMAAGISARSKKADEARKQALGESLEALGRARARLEALITEDAEAFGLVMAAYKLPKDDPAHRDANALPEGARHGAPATDVPIPGSTPRREKIQQALRRAAETPLETARVSLEALDCVKGGADKTVGTVTSDMRCAAHLLRAAVLCALENVEINLSLMKDASLVDALRAEADKIRAGAAPEGG